MNRNLQSRLARLEDEAKAKGGVRYTVSRTPLSEEDWKRVQRGEPPLDWREEDDLGPPLTDAEWEAKFCTPA